MAAPITIVWAQAAKDDLIGKTAADFGGVQPETYHENKVQAYWNANRGNPGISTANKARIRRAAHPGGYDPNAPDHITVSFRQGNKELRTDHVDTGR